MDKYLLLLLKEVNTIIIPGLGALTITNEKTGEIMFMPYLNYDDGKLATYIAEKEGFELNDAKNLISKYVREVQTILAKGESYDMFEFGTFLKDKSGDIVFKNWDGTLPSERSFDEINEIETDISIEDQNESEVVENIEIQEELTEEIIPTVEATIEFTEKEEIIEISELEIIDDVEEHEKEFIAEEESRIITPQDEKFIEEKIDVLKEDIKSTGEINQDEKNNNTNSALIVEKNETEQQLVKKKTPKSKSEKQAKLKTPKTSRKKKEKTINTNNKKKTILLTTSVLLLGLIVVSVFVFLNKDETYIVEQPNSKELAENNKNIEKTPENTEVNTLETETEIVETKVGDSLPVEPIEKEVVKPIEKKAVKSEIVKQVVVSTSSTHNYHIIGGSFSVEENANRFAEQMKSKGLNAQVLGKIDKLFVVSIGVYSSKIEAEQQNKAQNMKGWIFRK